MSARRTLIHLATKAMIGVSALFLVGVLIAAIPNHKPPVVGSVLAESEQTPQAGSGEMDHSQMPGMKMESGEEPSRSMVAQHDMASMGKASSAHMKMTSRRPESPADQQRAEQIADQLRAAIEKYKDYRVALNEGFKIFHSEIPQAEYHFTNYQNGFLEAFSFDPGRPTSLLYKRVAGGYELVGAMYTMPKRATEEQLNERVPLSIATWHLHTNLCMPPQGERKKADYTKFGLRGSITTQAACDAAGGKFYPVVFGWMVHVYPYEGTTQKIFAMHHGE